MCDCDFCRRAFGLPAAKTFSDITPDQEVAAILQQLYGNVNNIDPYVGGLAEPAEGGAHFGPLFAASITEQFLVRAATHSKGPWSQGPLPPSLLLTPQTHSRYSRNTLPPKVSDSPLPPPAPSTFSPSPPPLHPHSALLSLKPPLPVLLVVCCLLHWLPAACCVGCLLPVTLIFCLPVTLVVCCLLRWSSAACCSG